MWFLEYSQTKVLNIHEVVLVSTLYPWGQLDIMQSAQSTIEAYLYWFIWGFPRNE
jgi:hypothetical protein